jgi:hypothetical protein
LGTVAVLLAVETKSLIIGEAAVPEQVTAITTALESTPGVQRVIHQWTMHLGPDEPLVAGKIAVRPGRGRSPMRSCR